MLQPEETQSLKISKKKHKWLQLTVKKAMRKLKFYWYASWSSFVWLLINKVETQAVIRKISRMSQTGKQLQLWFLVSPFNIRKMRSRRKDLWLLSKWCENMGLGKKQQWWSIGEIQRQEALLCKSVPSCSMVGRDAWGHSSAKELLNVSFPPTPTKSL